MSIEGVLLCDISLTAKDKYYVISLSYVESKKKANE